jgi:putative AlgH/UPF0301 family transcriptional regulator
MTVYIGVDFHARKQTASYLTTEDGEIQQVELEHEKEVVRAFYEQFRGQKVIVGFESSGYAAWFEELLEELEYETWRTCHGDSTVRAAAAEERSTRC